MNGSHGSHRSIQGTSADGPSAARIRKEFDLSFAAPLKGGDTGLLSAYLRIRVGSASFAIALDDVSGLVTGRKVVSVPGAFPGLLGIAGYRGSLFPVVSIGVLLGQQAAANLRWFLLVRQAEPLALAFDGFEGHLRLPAASLASPPPDSPAADASGLLRGALQAGEELLPLLDVPSLSRDITRRACLHAPHQERSDD